MGKLVLRKTILRNMIDRVWAALELEIVLGEIERGFLTIIVFQFILAAGGTRSVCLCGFRGASAPTAMCLYGNQATKPSCSTLQN
jgi:hypothetical protein